MTEGPFDQSSLGFPISYELAECAARTIDENPGRYPIDVCARCLGCAAVVRNSGTEAVFDNDLEETLCLYPDEPQPGEQ